MLEINGITYEIIYSYCGVDGRTSAHLISIPIMLKKVDGE